VTNERATEAGGKTLLGLMRKARRLVQTRYRGCPRFRA